MWSRRLLAVVRNAIVWGAGWFLVAVAVVTVLLLTGRAPPDATWFRAMGLAARVGVVGGMAGALFALATIVLYRGRRMREMSWVRFGLAGAVISGLGMPLVLQGLNILSGDGPVAWHLLTDDIPLLAILGGGAAAVWLKLAQRSDERRSEPSPEGPRRDAPPSIPTAHTSPLPPTRQAASVHTRPEAVPQDRPYG